MNSTTTPTVWAVETFQDGHCLVLEGGLSTEADARSEAARREYRAYLAYGQLSIAQYVNEESGALVSRETLRAVRP